MSGIRLACITTACVLGFSATHLPAADSPPGSSGSIVPSDPIFNALLTDATRVSGRIRQFGPDGTISLVGETERTLALRSIVSLTRDGEPPPSLPEGSLVVFPDGDRLRAIINTSGDANLETLPSPLGDVATPIPLESILGVVLAPPSDSRALESILLRLDREPRDSEVAWLANGDRLAGSFLTLASDKLEFQAVAGKVDIPRQGVVAIGFDPKLVRYKRPEGVYIECTFTDGSRLALTDVRVDQGHILGTTRFGMRVRPPINALWRIRVRSDSVVYLSERSAAADQYTGYLGRHPETFGIDTTWDKHPLRVAGQPYDRGLGMLPRTFVAYRLEPRDRRFQALVGLDDLAGDKGSVVFRVLIDNREKFVSQPLTKRDAPVMVDLDVSGAKVLILVAEFGEGGHVQDSADWIEARLIR
jgi:hypothetical protein